MTRFALVILGAASLAAASPTPTSSAAAAPAAARKTVAILYFDNYTGRADYDPIGKGIASMMITDLSSVQEIQLVERDHLQELIKEMDRQGTKYFDSSTAVKVGRLAGAEYVVAGAVNALQPKIRLDTRVIRVQTGEIVKTAQVTGQEDQFFDLEQKLSKQLIDGLAIALSPEEQAALRERQEANRIDAMSTVLSVSQALAASDRGDYLDAVQKIQPALTASPNSMIVHVVYDELKRRAADKAKDKVKEGIRGLFRRP
ncbi:MAG: CsgG/HfaB family protein [Gemmatimonadaceae bacterium]